MVVDLVCEIVCVCVCERGKEGRFEAPAKRMCLGSVSFCRVKDYGRVAANEQEFSHTQLCGFSETAVVGFMAAVRALVTVYL